MEFGEPAVENLWINQQVFVQCCVLTGQDLELDSLRLQGCLKPYLIARFGTQHCQSEVIENLPREGGGVGAVQFYFSFVFETSLPGISSMQIEVRHRGLISDTLLGTCQFDIEDRYLTMQVREMREGTNEKFLKDSIAPTQLRFCSPLPSATRSSGWVDPPYDPEKDFGINDEGKTLIYPQRAPGSRMPIEVHDIQRQAAGTGTESRAGVLRLWLDITPAEAGLEKEREVPKLEDFQLRITIWRISNISIFKDHGVRNDVYVVGKFKAVDMHGNETHAIERTDVHRFANNEASFNWRWVLKIPAPVQEASLELIMTDEDRLQAHEQIYHPVVYSLDHLLSVAYDKYVEGRSHLGVLHETVVFDSWDETAVDTLFSRYCRCCWRRSGMVKRKFAYMQMDVELLPMAVATSNPVEAGNVAPPKSRLSFGSALAEPTRTVKILIGAQRYWNLLFLGCACTTLLVLAIIGALAYFVVSIVNSST